MRRPAVASTSLHRPSPARRRPPPVRVAVLLTIATAPLLATACSSDEDSRPPTATPPATTTTDVAETTTTTTEPTTTTAAPTPEEEVKAAYLEASAAFFHASSTADPDDPELARTRAGPSLELSQELLADLRKSGLRVEYVGDQPPVPTVRGVELVNANQAFVTVCLIDNARQVRESDGVVVDDGVLSRLDEADMRRSGGRWRLYALERLQRWEDGQGCDR